MTDAAIGYGSKFELETTPGSGIFTEIAEVTNITPPNEQADNIDASNMQSPNRRKEYIKGMIDPGETKFDMNFLPGSASEILILAALESDEAYAAKITYPGGQVWAFDIVMTGYAPSVPVNGKMDCTVTGKVTGSVVRT